jgi:hypothetical protein
MWMSVARHREPAADSYAPAFDDSSVPQEDNRNLHSGESGFGVRIRGAGGEHFAGAPERRQAARFPLAGRQLLQRRAQLRNIQRDRGQFQRLRATFCTEREGQRSWND